MLEFLINDFWHMIFCKIYIYIPIWKSSWTSLNSGICAKRANQYGSHVGFCVDKHILFKKLVMEIYSRFHGPEKKVSTTWWLWHVRDFLRGRGDASHNGRHLGFVEIRKGMISFLILLMSFLCRGTKIKIFNCKSEELWYIPFFGKNDVIWCYITLNYRYVGFMLISSI